VTAGRSSGSDFDADHAHRTGRVVYAKDPSRLTAFYAAIAGLRIAAVEAGDAVLESPQFRLPAPTAGA